MSVSVRMPQLGESVTEGTVTRWLKKEGDIVKADEPLLEVSTDKVDTEIPSPASGVLRGIAVAEEETVEVGAELAVIDEEGAAASAPPAASAPAEPALAEPAQPEQAEPESAPPEPAQPEPAQPRETAPAAQQRAGALTAEAPAADEPGGPPATPAAQGLRPVSAPQSPPVGTAPARDGAEPGATERAAPAEPAAAAAQPSAPPGGTAAPAAASADQAEGAGQQGYPAPTPLPGASDGPYITPLVRKLAAEHGVDLSSLQGTGVGGRIRKQDVLDASRAAGAPQPRPATPPAAPAVPRAGAAPPPGPAPQPGAPSPAPAQPAAGAAAPQRAAPQPARPQPGAAQPAVPPGPAQQPAPVAPVAPPARAEVEPSPLRGTTERMSRLRQLIAQRMVDSLRVSAQLTTVVEVDVTKIARLRERAKPEFEAREGVRLSFLPFFAQATLEALKAHPKLNAVIDTEKGEVTYHDVEHLGIAVDTDRGLLVPVIRNAGDLNIGGLARKISDLARRTRSGQVSPDELSGGTFTLTNTGSRGALFDTPIINQPQVAILGTGAVVKRPVVVDDAALGEVIAVRSMAYLALTYDHRLVDGADAARFLATVKTRLEEGAFEAELGL